MKELLTDVGISRANTRFMNVGDLHAIHDNYVMESSKNVKYLKNSRFT